MAYKEIKEVLKKGTKGDIAAVTLGFSAGFLADLFLLPVGVPPGTIGGITATTVYGIKKSAEATMDTWRKRKEAKNQRYIAERESHILEEKLETKAKSLLEILDQESMPELSRRLKSELQLWQKEIIDNTEFDNFLKEL